jgi:hypothetical protein
VGRALAPAEAPERPGHARWLLAAGAAALLATRLLHRRRT